MSGGFKPTPVSTQRPLPARTISGKTWQKLNIDSYNRVGMLETQFLPKSQGPVCVLRVGMLETQFCLVACPRLQGNNFALEIDAFVYGVLSHWISEDGGFRRPKTAASNAQPRREAP
jgi:hypothetical protein